MAHGRLGIIIYTVNTVQNNASPALMRILEGHFRSDPGREVCGFVYADRYVPLTNVSEDPDRFYADPVEVARALNRFGEPGAIFHSHTNGSPEPSAQDIRQSYYYVNSIILIGTFSTSGFTVVARRPPGVHIAV